MFFVVNAQKLTDNQTWVQSIFSYPTKEEALCKFHQDLSYNYTVGTLDAFSCAVLNEHLSVEAREFWNAPAPTPNE